MGTKIKSNDKGWIDISDFLYNSMGTVCTKMKSVISCAYKAIATVSATGDIGSLDISITSNDIEILNEKRRKLVYFANGIHYEIDELVDNPFSIAIGNIVEDAIGLNPSDISVFPKYTGILSECTSLTSLVGFSVMDEELKKDFEVRAYILDNDVLSYEVEQAIKEADYWEGEYQKAIECGKIVDNIFTDEVRKNWASLSVDEREMYLEQYRREIALVMGEGMDVSAEPMKFTASEYGLSYPGRSHIEINPAFVENPTGNYSLDKAIDTVTHETRHQYQNTIKLADEKEKGRTDAPDDLISGWYKQYDSKKDYDLYYHSLKEMDARAFAAVVTSN